jgi:hypothetical protein
MRWPAGFEPKDATVHAHNQIITAASPEHVWRWLCRAAAWPQWYSNCTWLKFPDHDGPDLKQGTRFVWKTFGATVRSKVLVFEPFREIGWDAFAIGLKAYHGWIIEPLDNGGCRIITEETQKGPLVTVGRWYLRRALLREHQNWLESLSRSALTGPPN